MVTVLLAVFSGEKYLREQIESILNQTVNDIKIVIRDDGSTDSSPEIIGEYAQKYPEKIFVFSGAPTGGAAANFGEMLKAVDDDYIMFSDQDDVWFPDKVRKTLDLMLKTENGDNDIPVLVHTDLVVTDSRLKVISDSFFDYQRIFPEGLSLNRLLVQNYVTGCTVMINRALKNRALPIPKGAAMHDWWLALSAAAFGRIATVKEQTIYYRQHGSNQVGAKPGRGLSFLAHKVKSLATIRKNYLVTYSQAALMLAAYRDILDTQSIRVLEEYLKLQSCGRIEKIKKINRYNFKKSTKLRVLGQYFLA